MTTPPRHAHPPPRVSFIGTGRLGSKLVARLLSAGYDVTVHDRAREAAEESVHRGGRWADSPARAVQGADVVFTCLPRAEITAELAEQEGGFLNAMGRGCCWIDVTTSDPAISRRLAAAAEALGVDFLECPVTGGVHLAEAGRLTVLVGGKSEVVEQKRAILECFAAHVVHLGEVGVASAMKVITNMLAFVHLVAAGEALMLAARSGIDLRQAFESIRASSGNSFVHETESQLVLSGSYDIGFTIDLALKDLRLVQALAEANAVPLELTDVVVGRFMAAAERYGGAAFSPRVVQLLEDDLGTPLRAPGFPATLEGTAEGT